MSDSETTISTLQEQSKIPSEKPQLKGFKGLIFDNPKDLAESVGIDPQDAELLINTHLMDENGILSKFKQRDANNPKEYSYYTGILRNIRDYRKRNGLTFTLSAKELDEFLTSSDHEIYQTIQGAGDLADTNLRTSMLKSLEDNVYNKGKGGYIRGSIEMHIARKIASDFRERDEAKIKLPATPPTT